MSSRDANATLSRRRFLADSALAAAAVVVPAAPRRARAAAPLKPVAMMLDWIYQGPNAGFMVAREKGFYREAGLEVSLTAGKGSGSTAQLIASKAAQIGFADGYVVGNSISKGMAITTVASIYRRNPAAVIVLADSSIKTAKDLEGRTVAMTAGSAQFQQWPAFVKGTGIDPDKIHIVNIDPAGVGPALVSGKADAIGGYVFSYAPSIEVRAKKKLRIFWFADSGVTIVSNGIIVHNDLLKSDPDLIRALARLLKGHPAKVNLIPFNPFPGTRYRRSPAPAIQRFRDELLQRGVLATIRRTRGDDIDAACGQLAGRVIDRTTVRLGNKVIGVAVQP